MNCLSISLLGSFEVTLDGEPVTRFGADTACAAGLPGAPCQGKDAEVGPREYVRMVCLPPSPDLSPQGERKGHHRLPRYRPCALIRGCEHSPPETSYCDPSRSMV